MDPLRLLIVEDDAGISEFLRVGLAYEGYDVQVFGDGLSALRAAERARPDVVVLDWMLPGMDGLEVCRRLRTHGDPAILMLTARDGLADRVLVARLRAILRRKDARPGQALRYADLELNPVTRDVRRGERSIDLTPREFDLLQLLLERPKRVFGKQHIIERVWGFDFVGDDNIVEVYIGVSARQTRRSRRAAPDSQRPWCRLCPSRRFVAGASSD